MHRNLLSFSASPRLCGNISSNQKGVSIIAVIATMLILAVMGVTLISLVTTGSDVSINQLQSEQAYNVAEGGKEYILANRTFPNYATQGATTNLGVIGSTVSNFKVDTPAYLTVAVAISNTTITVNDTSKFATAPGRIVIDSEVLAYTAKTGTTFTVAAATAAHVNGNAVYPVTTVSSLAIAIDTTINVASTTGFVIPGVIKIGSEYIYCTSSTATSFGNCTRGYKGSTAASHLGSNVFQYSISSTATVGTANTSNRVVRAAVYGSTSASGSAGVNIKQGNFVKSTTTPGPVSQTIAGVGFQPKAVIFFWTSRQTVNPGFRRRNNWGIGFTTSTTNERAVSIAEEDNVGTTNAGRRKSETNMIVTLSDGNPTLGAQAGLTSFNADGFTINWTTNDNRALYIYYIAIGGTDITNALASSFNSNTVIGNQAVTGLGFQPDFVMFLSDGREAADANDTNYSDSQLSLGFAESSAAMGAITTGSQDAAYTPKRSQQRTSACILILTLPAVSAQDGIADFVSMDADGFRINWSDAPALSTPIFYLALKGGRYNVGSFNQATALGNQSVTGTGFQPAGLMMASFNKIANNAIIADNEMSIGAAQSSTARGSIWGETQDALATSRARNYTNNAVVMTMATGTGNGTDTGTINAQADFLSFGSNGFTLNWTTVDATARQILYWDVGPTAQSTIPIMITHEEVY